MAGQTTIAPAFIVASPGVRVRCFSGTFAAPVPTGNELRRAIRILTSITPVSRQRSRVVAISTPPGTGDDDDKNAGGLASDRNDGQAGVEEPDEDDELLLRLSSLQARALRENDLLERLAQIEVLSDEPNEEGKKRAERYLSRETQLLYAVKQLYRDITFDIDNYLSKPERLLVAASLAILFGFFAATSATTIIGSVADWDPLAAAVLLVYVESFTRFYYKSREKGVVFRLANAFKVGLIYGCVVDCVKLGA
jgi:Protein of unknown function (DUF565)